MRFLLMWCPVTNRFSALKRSQVLFELHRVEKVMLENKMSTKSHQDAAKRRGELFLALQEKDAEILARFEKGVTYER